MDAPLSPTELNGFHPSCALTSSRLNFSRDDAVVLRCGGRVIDSIGRVGELGPWESGGVSTLNTTMRRRCGDRDGDRDTSDLYVPDEEYEGFPIDTFDDLGTHAFTCD